MKYQIIGVAMMATLLSSCAKKPANIEELEAFIDEPRNGLIQSRTRNEVLAEVKFQPSSLLATREFLQKEATAYQLDSVCAKYRSHTSFLLTFSKNNEELITQNASFSSYSQLIQALSFKMGQYVSLTTSMGDTLRPELCLFDRTYRLDTESRLLVVFPEKAQGDKLCLTIKEFGLDCGDMHFYFDANAIRQISDTNL